MTSRKPSAKAKRVAEFKSRLYGMDDSAFEAERRRRSKKAQRHEEALREKSCTSKNRYSTRGDAEEAIRACAEHGTRGLHCYKCDYCGGWHLTSKKLMDSD